MASVAGNLEIELRTCTQQCRHPKEREDRGSKRVNQLHRDLGCELVTDEYGWHISDEHASVVPITTINGDA